MTAFLSQVSTPKMKPPRIVLYGASGRGKSTFAASAKSPLFLDLEGGLGSLKVPTVSNATDYSDVMTLIDELTKGEHSYGTLVVDSLSRLEPIIWREVCQRHSEGKKPVEHIEEFGYGRGYTFADELWQQFYAALDGLRQERDMTMICIAHAEVVTQKDPTLGAWDRMQPRLHKRGAAITREWSDILGYMGLRQYTVNMGEGSKLVSTATNSGERVLYLQDLGGFDAKQRYGLPAELDIPAENGFAVLRNAIKAALTAAKE